MKRAAIALLLLPILFASPRRLDARPFITEEVPTVGKHVFEAGAKAFKRHDEFKSPNTTYETLFLPVSARLGLTDTLDIGCQLAYINQRLERSDVHFSGSRNSLASPFIKISPWANVGFMGIWHNKAPEREEENLPVVRGEDWELTLLSQLPLRWPITMNAGYVIRGGYHTKLGVSNGVAYHVHPGDIFQAKLAVEAPLKLHFSLVTEFAYYNFGKTQVFDTNVPHSAGEAADASAGLNWTFANWNLGVGAAFGLLDEKYTSFDLERGAGDYQLLLMASYRLTPRRQKT